MQLRGNGTPLLDPDDEKEPCHMAKLHLGCGRRYLEGYLNIDFPPSEHTVQKDLVADEYADIRLLQYPAESIEEIRLHHVFEHFPRPVALALLCRWRNWLRPGGVLRIETPDAMASFKQMASPFLDFGAKQQVLRHLFGSHEAQWALHADGWYDEKFRVTLATLGFSSIRVAKTRWQVLRNIEVSASKSAAVFGPAEYEKGARELLAMSAVRVKQGRDRVIPESESELVEVWMELWRSSYQLTPSRQAG